MYHTGKSQTVYVMSEDRISKADRVCDFQYEIKLESDDFDMVCLKGCSIPKTWYTIMDGNNVFSLVEGGVNYLITIPAASYSIKSLMTQLNILLSGATDSTYTYVCDISGSNEPQNGKLYFHVAGNDEVQPSFIFTEHSPFTQMGFSENTFAFVGDSLESPNVVYLQQTSSLLLISDCIAMSNSDYPILQSLYINTQDYSSITYLCPDIQGYSKRLVKRSNVYSFTLTDRRGRIMDLNGHHWSFTLIFYQSNDVLNLLKHSLQLDNEEKLQKLRIR